MTQREFLKKYEAGLSLYFSALSRLEDPETPEYQYEYWRRRISLIANNNRRLEQRYRARLEYDEPRIYTSLQLNKNQLIFNQNENGKTVIIESNFKN